MMIARISTRGHHRDVDAVADRARPRRVGVQNEKLRRPRVFARVQRVRTSRLRETDKSRKIK